MGAKDDLDELFLTRALRRGVLTPAKAGMLRSELRRRRQGEPGLYVHDLAVEMGLVDLKAALEILRSKPEDNLEPPPAGRPRKRDSETILPPTVYDVAVSPQPDPAPANQANDDPAGLLEPLTLDEEQDLLAPPGDGSPASAAGVSWQGPAPVPVEPEADDEGEVLFDSQAMFATEAPLDETGETLSTEGQASSESSFSASGETFWGGVRFEQPPGGEDALEESDATERPGGYSDSGETLWDGGVLEPLSGEDESAETLVDEPVDAPANTVEATDLAAYSELAPDSPAEETAPATKMEPGRPQSETSLPTYRDKTETGIEEMDEITVFDSSSIKAARRAQPETGLHDLSATAVPTPPPESTEAEEFNVSITLPGAPAPEGKASTIYDDSDLTMDELQEDESSRDISTGSRTIPATGVDAQAGLGKGSKLGIESNITDRDAGGAEVHGIEMTVADLRRKMGLGEGVKVAGKETAYKTMQRLQEGGVRHRRYSVLREIARGGMGKVLEVEDIDLRRSVALKVLRKEMLGRKDLVERFLEEAQITGQLEHPNIVPVHEIGVDGRGNLYFTMKMVEGEELSSVLKRLRKGDASAQREYPLGRLLDVFVKVCEGVSFAHSRGVIHRDLKPANIMVGRFGEVQIMDWGVAKIVGRKEDTGERVVSSDRVDADSQRTMAGSILGTPSYMSPEQARGENEKIGPLSDLFSLGVILYEILALKTPWTGRTSAEVIDQVQEAEMAPPGVRAPERRIPPELEALCMRCLALEARDRIGSVADLIDNLRSYLEGRTMAAVQYSMSQLLWKWVARHKIAVLGAAAVLIALVGGVVATVGYFKQREMEKIPDLMEKAEVAATESRSKRETGEYQQARDRAVEAMGFFDQVRKLDEGNEEAARGYQDMAELRGQIGADEQRFRENAEQEKAEREKRERLNDALTKARQEFSAADELALATFSADGGFNREAKGAYEKASAAFIAVQAIEPTNQEAFDRLKEVEEWMDRFEFNQELIASLESLGALVEEAEEKLAEAMAVEGIEEATPLLQDVIRICDRALAEAPGEAAAEAGHEKARYTKADAALNFAARALAENRFYFCKYMLGEARDTMVRTEEVSALESELAKKEEANSHFRSLFGKARTAVETAGLEGADEQAWDKALQSVREAEAEAVQSEFAAEADRAQLRQWAELAQLEPALMRADEALADPAVETLSQVGADLHRLVDDVLQDEAYRLRARRKQAEVRSALVDATLADAEKAEGAVAIELLKRALELLPADDARRGEVEGNLEEAAAQAARAGQSDRVILLPRGSFLIGSPRDGDHNPQVLVEIEDFLFIDRYPVTNAEYAKFVAEGGYERVELWDEEALAHIPSFLDSTGLPAPKDWTDGAFDPAVGNHPVTGVCWYEARAYARWVEKRLPTASEWEVAAGAPASGGAALGEYPFGGRAEAEESDGADGLREVGTAEWDRNPLGVRDLGCNAAEWTDTTQARSDARAVVKGAEPGMKFELFLHYARRAKNSSADKLDRSSGRGFRCIEDFRASDTKSSRGSEDGSDD